MPDQLTFPKVPIRDYPENEERGHLSAKDKVALVTKQRKKCKLCGCTPSRFEFDHVLALSEGGTNDPSNWQALCRDCHVTKGKGEAARRKKRHKLRDKTSQWARRQKNKPDAKVNRDGSLSVRRT